MVYELNPKKSTHQWTISFAKSKTPYFWGAFWHYPQNEIFSQKIRLHWFFTLFYPQELFSPKDRGPKIFNETGFLIFFVI